MAGPRGSFVAVVLGACALAALLAFSMRLARYRVPVELKVSELMRMRSGQPVLVLAEKNGLRKLPVPISRADAALIEGAMAGRHRLVPASVEALGGRVVRACIDEIGEREVRARLVLAGALGEVQLDSRAAEALALALEAGAPIVVDEPVLEQDGISPDDLLGKSARSLRSAAAPAPVLGI